MHQLISNEADLRTACASIGAPYVLLADCEFVRERTFWPKLGLVQLRVGERIWLVDPLPLPRDSALADLIRHADQVVMHSPSEDFECLQHSFGCLPRRLFDTQLAAAFCGLGTGLSYRAVVEHFTGVQLDKAETRSDWLARPLSDSQLRYAADDVLHLSAVHQGLQAMLDARGRRAWFEADCDAALAKARNSYEAEPVVQLERKQVQRLSARAIARLQCIFDWREREARRLDRPRSWLIDNEVAYRLANTAPGDESAHRKAFEGATRVAKHAPAALWPLLQALDHRATGAAASATLNIDEGQFRRRIATLQDCVADLAKQLDLPPSLLFPRRLIEQMVETGQWPDAARGWREQVAREPLQAALKTASAS